jgi:hypothetical protein
MSESIELVAADVPHKYWLIYAYKNGTHHELRVRPVDVSQPIASAVGTVARTATTSTSLAYKTYTLKASPQHNRIAIANSDDKTVDVFDFDNATGALSNRRTTPSTHLIDGVAYGVEFSPDGNQLYAAGYTKYGGSTPMLCQYTITSTGLIYVNSIQYWNTTEPSNSRGGGLKLGPDGRIYVMLAYDKHVGIISDADSTQVLTSRYDPTGLELNVDPSSYGLQFSTGLTRPSEMECNVNDAPVTIPDVTTFCVTATSRTVTTNVLKNDSDPDGNAVYLTGADFVNASDTVLAKITFKSSDSISLTLKPDAYIGTGGHKFEIEYHVRDNGTPAAQCATGLLTVTVYPTLNYPDIRVRVCPGVTSVNLAKYIDTAINVSSIQWGGAMSGSISSAGVIAVNGLAQLRVHTFTYTVDSYCGGKQTRKFYLEMLRNKRPLLPRDTIVLCYTNAESVHIDQLFGVEGGQLSYTASPYITKSSGGATVMNGKALYEDDHTDSFRGKNNVKIITFTYTPDSGNCLVNSDYKITIVLTDDVS